MQDFSLNEKIEFESNPQELSMSVSSICQRDKERVAYVTFSDKKRNAEGIIPSCRIIRNNGFSDEELTGLEDYMRAELPNLKKMASKINVMDAFMGREFTD